MMEKQQIDKILKTSESLNKALMDAGCDSKTIEDIIHNLSTTNSIYFLSLLSIYNIRFHHENKS
jgi:hypothetical protein